MTAASTTLPTLAGAWWPRVRPHLPMATLYVAGGAVAYGLKAFYSGANADDLRWVLGPTCWLAARLGGTAFSDEASAGFISHIQHLVVGSACSGLNFLIAGFAALFFSFAHRLARGPARAGWLPASLVMAWLATVATNAVRVTLAGPLYQADIYGAIVTQERMHRLLGTVLYCGSLVLLHGLVARCFAGGGLARRWRGLQMGSPFAFYLGLAVVVPLLRRGQQGLDARLLEHLATVVGIALVLAGLCAIANRRGNRLQSKASQE